MNYNISPDTRPDARPMSQTRESFLLSMLFVFLCATFAVAGAAEVAENVDNGATTGGENVAQIESPIPMKAVFGPGEKMVFSIGYGVISAGEGTLEVVGMTEYQGHTCYQIQSKANSNRFFSSIYKVRDKIISYIDVDHLYSRYFFKRLREGDYKKSVEISFDHQNGIANYADGQTFPIVYGVQDVLSAFFYVRNLDLEVGQVYSVPAHSSRKSYDLQVIVHGKEKVSVEAGTWDCFVVEPIIEGDGLFKHEGKLTLYITDDEYRVPVMIKTKVPVGSIDVELKEYRPGHPFKKK